MYTGEAGLNKDVEAVEVLGNVPKLVTLKNDKRN